MSAAGVVGVALFALLVLWVGVTALLALRFRGLISACWQEPYFLELPVLIESDDWGPGPDWHAERLQALTSLLAGIHDTTGRSAVLTADMVLSVPDAAGLKQAHPPYYRRRWLHEEFPVLHAAYRLAYEQGQLVPQLHGVEHCYGEGLQRLAEAGDPRLAALSDDPELLDWEHLDSPLQAHHVDATRLPSQPLDAATQAEQIEAAMQAFVAAFGFRPRSAVAPCYLWDNTTEACWAAAGVRYVQTAGYRCIGRDATGRYQQSPPILRLGDRVQGDLLILVRNCMYEPVDGRGVASCLEDIRNAIAAAAPIVISCHRYNFTRTLAEHQSSLLGLKDILITLQGWVPNLRFLSSPELGDAIAVSSAPEASVGLHAPPPRRLRGVPRLAACYARLSQRHAKFRWLMQASLLDLALFPVKAWAGSLRRRALRTRGQAS